ncbi:hypothetical protein A2W14_03075 [Candidatus Gottesmanbacteria bacterium RBG_16_37_8]|uniref:Peptidase S9 prolyl oligopeptidase catalytic domain-containing protein n=1 Tax=Candidatus Gottesmanbacteria bacterium RBG_16_37_8 TaxID=1798371 RepID=A0A1F5YUI2_9BACT|nr:MAG: hypothetical protein A2W14_03075 [Candidatus Gottesmanbacteria bacterium RBG_16_37_8]
MHLVKKYSIELILFFIGLIVLGFIFFKTSKNSPVSPDVSPTPFPFAEMTIPYLRNRTYQSSLGDLKYLSENQAYTSYLTSYDSDSLQIFGLLTKPKGDVPKSGWPVIIFIHGYIPPAEYRTAVNYSSYVDYLARNGFVVFKIDLRGHDNSQGEAGGAYYSADYIIDTLNAYAVLQNSDFVDSTKIGLWGHSMAGNVILRSLAAKPEIPAAVIWAGAVFSYSDMQKYGINDGSYQPPPNNSNRQRKRSELRNLYGDFDPESPFWQQVTPVNYLNDLKGALMLNHAIDDNVVNIGYSRDLIELLNKAQVLSELKEYPSGGHNLTGVSFTNAMQNTVEFFRSHL